MSIIGENFLSLFFELKNSSTATKKAAERTILIKESCLIILKKRILSIKRAPKNPLPVLLKRSARVIKRGRVNKIKKKIIGSPEDSSGLVFNIKAINISQRTILTIKIGKKFFLFFLTIANFIYLKYLNLQPLKYFGDIRIPLKLIILTR